MADSEAYMLQRNPEESRRLDTQHDFLRALAHGELIHPSVPRQRLRAVADVATGTGVWLQDTFRELTCGRNDSRGVEFVGFDISPSQFPDEKVPGIDFFVHDVTEAFPPQYHAKFDLVHVRLLSYAIKAQHFMTLKLLIDCVSNIGPGGYLQWQECDAIDSWAIPETPVARAVIAYVVSERLARGLTPAIVTTLVKTIQSLSSPTPHAYLNPLSWTDDVMRIMHLETLSTTAHPSPRVQSKKEHVIKGAALQFLQAGASRRLGQAADPSTPVAVAQELAKASNAMTKLADDIKTGGEYARSEWDMAMTRIIARKAVILSEAEPWMSVRHGVDDMN